MAKSTVPVLIALSSSLLSANVMAQDTTTGWLAWFHQQALDERWQFVADAQLRTDNGGGPLQQIIVRPSISYQLNSTLSLSAGYAYVENINRQGPNTIEHRPWQQALFRGSEGDLSWAHRIRLEQRFIDRPSDDIYSDRLRYLVRFQHKLPSSDRYLALHNETFINLSGQDQLNGRRFDQNRLGVLLGVPLSKQIAFETGYTNQYIKGRIDDRQNHVININLVSRF